MYFDITVVTEIVECNVNGHYADSLMSEAISPARQDGDSSFDYIIGSTAATQFDFTFGDFTTTTGNGCETGYPQTYSLLLDGNDVTQSLPSWVTNFY